MKKTFVSLGAIVFAIGILITIAGQSATKSQTKLKGAIAATSATTAPADTASTAASTDDTTASAPAETLTDKLDRFFAQEPELAGFDAATRACAEKSLSGVVTSYEMDNLLGADHSDPNYQTVVAGAKMTASGCQLEAN
jgi:hypothetical protein